MKRCVRKAEEARRLAAKIARQGQELPVCPECGSAEVSGPSHSDPWSVCADCGHAWPLPGWEALFRERFGL